MLQERGLVSVDDDIRKFIPELPQYAAQPVRISDMLHHISGLPSYFDLKNVPMSNKTYWVSEDYPAEFARQQRRFPLQFPTGRKYEYNNTNFLLMAVGQSFAFVGLVSSLILQSFFSGGLASPYRVLTFSAFLHLVRIFGGQVGTTLMTRFIAEQEKLHSYLLGLHVQPGDWITDRVLHLLTAGLAARSSGTATKWRPTGPSAITIARRPMAG